MEKDMSLDLLSELIFSMKYARWIPNKKRKETFEECIDRNKQMHLKKFPKLKDEIEAAYKYVYEKKVLPSSRSLQFAGKAIELNNVRGYNCSFLPIDHIDAFKEIAFCLMSGTGVGYSIQYHHINKLPEVYRPKKERRYLIGDSVESWAESIGILMESYMGLRKSVPVFDYGAIRDKGERLKVSGGCAPGPLPLMECHFNIKKILDQKENGNKLTSLECHDILCYIATCVVVGGTRRSSMISLFDFNDNSIKSCKTGNWEVENPQRAMANNSAAIVRHKITEEEFCKYFDYMNSTKMGEPGIWMCNDPIQAGINPCLTGDTLIAVADSRGFVKIRDLAELEQDIPTYCIDKKRAIKVKMGRYPRKTGTKVPIYKVCLEDGNFVRVTGDHKFLLSNSDIKEASKLERGDSLQIVNFFGDPIKDIFPKSNVSSEDGGWVQKVVLDGYEDVYNITVDVYHNIIIGGFPSLHPKFKNSMKTGIVTLQCGEASLKSGSYCNITIINMSTVKDQEDFNNRAKVAAFIGSLQASYTNFHLLRDFWKEQTEEDALLGVTLTGLADENIMKLNFKEAAQIVVEENERVANFIGINKAARTTFIAPGGTSSLVLKCSSGIHTYWSKYYIRRVRVSKDEAIYQYLKKEIPNLIENDFFKPDTQAVISIPIKAPDNAITRHDETALQFLERVKKIYTNWVKPGHRRGSNTHNVSSTCYIKDNELERVKSWLWENRDKYTAITILPSEKQNYPQMPLEEIDEKTYKEMYKHLKQIDLTKVKEYEDNTNFQGEIACGGGSCEIV